MKWVGTAAAVVAATILGFGVASIISDDEPKNFGIAELSTAANCEDWSVQLTRGECQAAGAIRFVALHNLQGAAQFCKWHTANPGEWTRIKTFAGTGDATGINLGTWLGSSIRNQLEAYFATGAPPFTIQPNTAPNRCRTPLAPPVVEGVTPGETDVTITIED